MRASIAFTLLLTGLVLCLAACMATTNRPMVAAGVTFDRSWKAAHEALARKDYAIASEDESTGKIITTKRFNKDWWWTMETTVHEDGTVEFLCHGSPNVHTGRKIHRRLLNFAAQLRNTFQEVHAHLQ